MFYVFFLWHGQDNGDGQITFSEFIDGAARLRGGAKALDIWRGSGRSDVFFFQVINGYWKWS